MSTGRSLMPIQPLESRHRLGNIADQVSNLRRTKQLYYTWLRSLMGRHADYWKVTQAAPDYAFDISVSFKE